MAKTISRRIKPKHKKHTLTHIISQLCGYGGYVMILNPDNLFEIQVDDQSICC